MAANATTDQRRVTLEQMSHTWESLARQRERQLVQQRRIARLNQLEKVMQRKLG